MNRQAQAVVMLLFGGAVLKVTLVGDAYLRYVKAGLRPFLIGAGALLVLAAVVTLVHELRDGRAADPGGTDPGTRHDHHGHEHAEPRIGWAIVAPVLGLLLVAPPAMGAYAAGESGTALSAVASSEFAPLPQGDPVTISVLDYASRAVFDRGASLSGRRVLLTGFVAQGPNGTQVLARMILSCCAADARPIKIGMSGDAPVGLADDTWIEVVGVYSDRVTLDEVNGEKIPFIEVMAWRQITPPKQQYE